MTCPAWASAQSSAFLKPSLRTLQYVLKLLDHNFHDSPRFLPVELSWLADFEVHKLQPFALASAARARSIVLSNERRGASLAGRNGLGRLGSQGVLRVRQLRDLRAGNVQLLEHLL